MILASQNIITGQDASLPLLLATFTPTVSGVYFANVNLSLLAGTGVYRFITTRQIGGTGTIYQSGTSAIGVSAGVTTLTILTIPTPLLAGDILKVYVQGLDGDTAIDGVTEIFRSNVLTDSDLTPLAKTTHLQEVENKIDAIDTDTVMSFMIDGFTFEQIIQIMASVLAGKLTRSGDTLTFRDLADTVDRVVAETDANKQRTTMTYTV